MWDRERACESRTKSFGCGNLLRWPMEIDGWFLGSEINPERRFAEDPQTARPRRNGTLACAFDPELVPEASPTVGPGRGGKAAGPRRLPRGDAVGHAGRRARQEGPDPAADSSPNTPRYLAFKAATFRPRNSSIARTTAGSIDAVPFSGCLPQLHGRFSVWPGKQVRTPGCGPGCEEHDRPRLARSRTGRVSS